MSLNPEYDSYEQFAEETRVVGPTVQVSRRLLSLSERGLPAERPPRSERALRDLKARIDSGQRRKPSACQTPKHRFARFCGKRIRHNERWTPSIADNGNTHQVQSDCPNGPPEVRRKARMCLAGFCRGERTHSGHDRSDHGTLRRCARQHSASVLQAGRVACREASGGSL